MNTISGFQSGLNGMYRGMNALRDNAHVIASQGTTTAAAEKDVNEAIVGLNANSHQVEASAKVIKTQDELLGSLLDEMA